VNTAGTMASAMNPQVVEVPRVMDGENVPEPIATEDSPAVEAPGTVAPYSDVMRPMEGATAANVGADAAVMSAPTNPRIMSLESVVVMLAPAMVPVPVTVPGVAGSQGEAVFAFATPKAMAVADPATVVAAVDTVTVVVVKVGETAQNSYVTTSVTDRAGATDALSDQVSPGLLLTADAVRRVPVLP